MRNQMMFQRKRHLTLVTPIRPLRRVQQQMRVEAMLAGERFPTVRTHMRPFTYKDGRTEYVRFEILPGCV